MEINREILGHFLTSAPAKWSDVQAFAADGFQRETGIEKSALENKTDQHKAQLEKADLLAEAEGFQGPITFYRTIYDGAEFLEARGETFNLLAASDIAQPIRKAQRLGVILNRTMDMIHGLIKPEEAARRNMTSLFVETELSSAVKLLQKELPTITTVQIMDCYRTIEPLLPQGKL